ncbi:MAG: glycosyltransferase family 1 protein [Betaproteobacteria bacterium]|jgi:mannosyltransferase|nr:glycosyltransferase family 1 protein [Betaproteobacteria bacterium]
MSATAVDPEIIVCNIKRRFTGVSGTVNALIPVQARQVSVGYLGTSIPGIAIAQAKSPQRFARLSFIDALWLSCRYLPDGRKRIWHLRRDHEMLLAILLRDLFRLPINLVFTSAAKHRHSWFPRWLISRMDGVISTTPEAAAFVPNTLRVVPHGISLERFEPPADKAQAWSSSALPGRYGIGVFGRVRPDKGSDLFVEAMLRVLPQFPDFYAVIAGLTQPQHQAFQRELQARIDARGLSERIRFLGEIPPDQVGQWYRRVLITVACPRYEPFGLTPLEGMASGCAVVASDTGAFRSMVDEGVTGYVVPTEDVDGLAERLSNLMRDPVRAIEMGQRGRQRVQAMFSVEQEAEGISAVYKQIWQQGFERRA